MRLPAPRQHGVHFSFSLEVYYIHVHLYFMATLSVLTWPVTHFTFRQYETLFYIESIPNLVLLVLLAVPLRRGRKECVFSVVRDQILAYFAALKPHISLP